MNVASMLSRYTKRWLALWAQGFLGFMGIAKETTWGTGVAATDFFEILNENITTTLERYTVKNAFGNYAEPDDVVGVRRNAGDLTMWGHPVSLGHLLKAAMQTVSGSVVLSGFLFLSRFITTKSEFASGVPVQPHTLEVHRDTTSSFRYTGALCSRLQLSLVPNQDLRATVGWITKGNTIVARSSPTFPSSPIAPFAFETASISIAGAANVRFEAFNLTIDNALEGIPGLLNSDEIAKIRRRDVQMVSVGGTLDFLDHAEYDDFINQTERTLKLNLFRSNSFNLLIDIPRFVYTAYPLGIGGRERLTVAFEGKARYNIGSGLALDMGLTSTKSNW